MTIEIVEGPRTMTGDITFEGNKAFSSSRLKQIIKSGTTNFLSFLLNNDIYDPDRLEGVRC